VAEKQQCGEGSTVFIENIKGRCLYKIKSLVLQCVSLNIQVFNLKQIGIIVVCEMEWFLYHSISGQ
jgi:hypothetical protein